MTRVFLRADLNIPLDGKKILSDFKLKSILPTIDLIKKRGHKIVLATHIGRPDAKSEKNFFDENLSTKILIPWFEKQGYKIDYEIDLLKAVEKSKKDLDTILLLENLRFFNGEKETNDDFAQILAKLGDTYVNDAFGVIHRNDTSVSLLPKKFETKNRFFGLLIEKEIKNLEKLREKKAKPFIVVLGGKKTESKLKDVPLGADVVLIGGALAKSPFLENFLKKIGLLTEPPKIVLPVDFHEVDGKTVDIGPKTIEIFKKEISLAKTIFTSGTMGIYENDGSDAGSHKILKAIAQSKAFSVVGGGDAVAATHKFGLESKMGSLSTGGGSATTFLASENPKVLLPGLNSINLFIKNTCLDK